MDENIQNTTENKFVDSADELKEGLDKAIENPDDPLSDRSLSNIEGMLRNLESIVSLMQSQWMASAKELKLNDSHMRQLAVYNDKYKELLSEDASEEEKNAYDPMNGINHMTMDEIREVFGEEHPIYGVDESHTMDRLKGACHDFYHWVASMKEYQNVHDAYIRLIELEEENNINELRKAALEEEDEEKKATKLAAIEKYYNLKYLDFLQEDIDPRTKESIINALSDEKKVEYWLKRTRDKLGQLKISSKFILEIAQFESRFMEEKYHKCSNLLLLYFMRLCIGAKCSYKDNEERTKVVSMVTMMDFLIRNQLPEDKRTRVMNNIIAFEEQLIDDVPEAPVNEEITPPITE